MNNMSASNPTLSIELAAATTKAQDISIDHLLVFVIHSKSFCIRLITIIESIHYNHIIKRRFLMPPLKNKGLERYLPKTQIGA